MSARRSAGTSRAGFTLLELVVAMGLVSIVMLAVYRLLDSTMSMWTRGETQRALVEASSATGELLTGDLRGIHPGIQGDMVAEWVAHDSDGDGLRESYWPRLRLVRAAPASTVARLLARSGRMRQMEVRDELDGEAQTQPGAEAQLAEPSSVRTMRMPGPRLMEVVWCVVPTLGGTRNPDLSAEGLLIRGERLLDGTGTSVFAPGYFDGAGLPQVGTAEEVTGGILWCGMAFASQMTLLDGDWKVGAEPTQAAGSWDAWGRGRPDRELHEWNEPAAGAPPARERPVLPRRVRIELELEREVDRERRARTLQEIAAADTSFEVTSGERLPEPGSFLRVGAEWMELGSRIGNRVSVRRGQRGTAAMIHPANSMVHHGETVVFEVPVSTYQDDWNYRE